MQQRNSTIGRPSGTDGSDYSYRMVVDSRYQQVAKGKKRLSILLSLQALLLLIAAIFAALPGIEQDTLDNVALGLVVCGLIILIVTELGRRRSRAIFLRVYPWTEFLPFFLLRSLAKRHFVIKENLFWRTKFDRDGFPVFGACLLLYIVALVVVKMLTSLTISSLISNMSPPRKAKAS
ncbi:hypothetical protein QN277_001862 [Acacia crassicarpa]|uniref:Uncharacterized protein n=1 Tax=Acacia crassicarpa TaxID=499986 RepID=A0AAE1N810_9FABA|nr:hypothetical protein QN277_001862 [Acacia crassicarpa]